MKDLLSYKEEIKSDMKHNTAILKTNLCLARLENLIKFMEFFKISGRKRVSDVGKSIRDIGFKTLTLTSEMKTIKRKMIHATRFPLFNSTETQTDELCVATNVDIMRLETRDQTIYTVDVIEIEADATLTDSVSHCSDTKTTKTTKESDSCFTENVNLKETIFVREKFFEMDIENDPIVPDTKTDLQLWDEQKLHDLLNELIHYQPLKGVAITEDDEKNIDVPYVNILLVGPTESGKSSYILLVYCWKKRHQPKFRICIYRGSDNDEKDENKTETDIQYIIKGHITHDYVFTGDSISAENPNYRRHPMIKDKVHCVVFVFDSSKLPIMTKVQETAQVQKSLNAANIPQLILMNNIGKLSKMIQKDVSKVFQSENIQLQTQHVSKVLGLPAYSVLPMENIHYDHTGNTALEILTLYNLRQMLRATDDFLLNNHDDLEQDKYERGNQVSIDVQFL
ncbi:unnamed protein product [Mytilus edulis]|uniref:Uncharacterized protein n=1 Tax=Mytilus edulis TaxID=6550 RepID=A0A8S3V5P1_MYTED|nr:unnamed protein product [Mytilus edulis]